MRELTPGSTSQSLNIFIQNSASTVGGGATGIVYNATGLTAYYHRDRATSTTISLATLTHVTGNWLSGGFKEIDQTNMPGMYRLDLPDASLAVGVNEVSFHLQGAANMAPCVIGVNLRRKYTDNFTETGSVSGNINSSPVPLSTGFNITIGVDRQTGTFDRTWCGIVSGSGTGQWRRVTTHTKVSTTVANLAFGGATSDPDGAFVIVPATNDVVMLTGRG